MSKIFVACKYLLVILICIYFLWPKYNFPEPSAEFLQSYEPADTESIYRKSYFTNMTRDELMQYYDKQFWGPIQYRLKVPPEFSYELIRDQTKTSYIEEIIHPMRNSLYINVFVPTKPNDEIYRNGNHYLNKVTIRYIPSSPISNITVFLMMLLIIYWVKKEIKHGIS